MKWILITILSFVNLVHSKDFTSVSNDFATNFYQRSIQGHHTNVIMSPLSIQSTISVLLFGAYGQTEQEMRNSLSYSDIDLTNSQLAEQIHELRENIGQIEDINFINKIFLQKGYNLKKEFKEIAENSFELESEEIDFDDNRVAAKTINDWAEKNTENKIKDLVDPSALDDSTLFVLANAIHFKGDWKVQFDPKLTESGYFFRENKEVGLVDYMKSTRKFNYKKFKNINASAVEIDYNNYDMSMFIILPDFDSAFEEVEGNLGEIDFNTLKEEMHEREINLEIPKFKIEHQVDMKRALSRLGMGRMLTSSAEFRNIIDTTQHVKVSQVVHKSFISVDETGVEAAAASSVQFVSIFR